MKPQLPIFPTHFVSAGTGPVQRITSPDANLGRLIQLPGASSGGGMDGGLGRVLTQLDSDRYFRVHLMDELNRSLPEHMWLTRFEDVGGDTYAVEGVTFSNFLVSDFLQNITRSPYFSGINLLVAEKGDIGDVKVVKFKAQARAARKSATVPFEG